MCFFSPFHPRIRSASVLFRNRLLNIRNYTSQQTGNMHTTSEMITTNLPYFRYFVAVPRHIQFPTTLKNYILSIDPRNRSSLNLTTADDDPYDLSEKIAGRSSQSQITNIENRINFPSTSGIDIEDIDSFSD